MEMKETRESRNTILERAKDEKILKLVMRKKWIEEMISSWMYGI